MTLSNSSSARVSARRAAASSARGEQIGELTPGRACNAVGENLHSDLDLSQKRNDQSTSCHDHTYGRARSTVVRCTLSLR